MITPARGNEIISSPILWAILALIAGFADLLRGGTTLSAFALAIAYCLLIPLAIWRAGRSAGDVAIEESTPSYEVGAIVALAIFVLYLITMAPSTAMWDTSEYIAAAYVFGLPHPPGNPFFVIIGHVFSLLPIARSVAARINVLAALCSALSAGLWFLVTEHVLQAWLAARWQRITGGVLAALIGATSFTVWNQSVVNEKVYTVSLVGIAIVSWLAVRWSAQPDGRTADRLLVMVAYLCGLGYANHMAGMLPAPAVAVLVLVRRPRTILRWKLLLACALTLVVGLTPFATQPIRAAYFPPINEGEPTACRTKLELSCTFSKGTYDAFMYNFNRGQYGKPDLSDRQATFPQQIGMWWLYFKWQWIRDPTLTHVFAQALLAAVFLVLGLIGGWVHWQRDRRSFWYFGPLMFTITLLLIYYLNFKLGFSQDPTLNAEHEVRDRDYFFLWSFSAWGVWAALGLVHVWESIAEMINARSRSFVYASPVLALAVIPLFANWSSASRAHHTATRNMAADMLNSVEPYGVLVTVGDNDTFPLWYAQEVEGIRRDVVVACTSLLNTDWYVRQLIRRPIYTYDAANGPAIYRGTHWIKPTTPPLHMTMSQADSVPEYYELRGPMVFQAKNLRATIDPKNLEYGVLQRADYLVLHMIADSWPERPIYIARSGVGYPRQLGLERNVLTQGLASKVFVPTDTAAMKDTLFIQGDGWLDVPRTKALWETVFRGPQAAIQEGHWIDRASVSMPSLYVFSGVELADALDALGDRAGARAIMSTDSQLAHATGLEAMIRGVNEALEPPQPSPGDSRAIPLPATPPGDTPSTEPKGERPKKP